MFKKTLLALAVASSVGLTGCLDDGSSGKNANPDYKIDDTTIDRSIVRPVFNPNPLADTAVPVNFDLLLLLGASQGPNYDFTGLTTGTTPADSAINDLSGFSTTGQFNLAFDGSLNPDSVIKGQTVFLVPLTTKPVLDTAPLALPPINPTQITGVDKTPANQPNFRVEVITQDGVTNNTIRITPLEPLLENTKYIVIVSDGVIGANGKPIEQSIEAQQLTEGPLGNSALQSVRDIINASNGLGQQIIAASGKDVALAYTMTTNGHSTVLKAMASPATYLTALGQKIGFTALLKAVRDNNPEKNFSELTTILGKIQKGDTSAGAPGTAAAVGAAAAVATESNIGSAIAARVADGSISLPLPRPSFFYKQNEPAENLATIQGLAAADPNNQVVTLSKGVSVSQGAIVLPYYQPIPAVTGGESLVKQGWQGDTTLETKLNESLNSGTTTFEFLRDLDGTLNVNANFPYPKIQGQVAVPVVVYKPDTDNTALSTCGSAPLGVTIFQHGITVDRSVSMLPGILLASQACQAVIAIDQPLHGLSGPTLGTVTGLDELTPSDIGTVFDQVPGLAYIGERHFNYTDAGSLTPVQKASATDVKSGSLFINLKHLQGARDNLRQGVIDLLNVAATLDSSNKPAAYPTKGFDIDRNGSDDFAGLPVNFIGHSLGGITGTVFAELSSDPVVRGAYAQAQAQNPNFPSAQFPSLNSVVLHNTGGQITKLVENSPTFASRVLPALPAQGTSNLETFLYVFQSVVDSVDPAVYAKDLGKASSSVNILTTEVVGDTTVPNEANVNPLGNALSAPLAGTEPLMALIDLGAGGTKLSDGSEGSKIVNMSTAPTPDVGLPASVFFDGTNPCAQANHGTFVAPIVDNDACPGGKAITKDAFTSMVTQTGALVSPAGATLPVSPDIQATLGTSLTIESALDQDK